MSLAAVAVTAIAAHGRSLLCGFVYDDQSAILDNPVVQRGLDVGRWLRSDFWGLPVGQGVGTWRPLPVLGFWLDRHLGGGAAWVFHLDSLLWHAAASVLLALAVRRARIGVCAGLLFAALAVGSEAVDGLVGRADLMAASFAFLAWWCRGSLGAAAAGFAALLCKESALAVPVFVVVADWIERGRISWRRLAAQLGAAAVYLSLRTALFAGPGAVKVLPLGNPLVGADLASRAVTGLRLGALALRLIIAPVGLSADYGYAEILPGFSFDALAGGLALAAAAAAVLLLRRREPLVATGLALFLVAFAPISNVAALLPAIFAERLLVLPAAGIAVALAAAISRWRAGVALLALLIAANFARSVVRAGEWRDDLALFGSAVEVTPRSVKSWTNYGVALLERGRNDEALAAFTAATEIMPSWAVPRTFAGVTLARLGHPAAESQLRAALALDEDLEQAAFNLAGFLARNGRRLEAVDILKSHVARHPDAHSARRLLESLEY